MSKRDVLALAERCRAAVIPVESATSAGSLAGYVRVIDLAMSDSRGAWAGAPLLEIRDNSTLLAVLTRLESANEGLAAVVNARGETIGIVTTRRLREPLLREG